MQESSAKQQWGSKGFDHALAGIDDGGYEHKSFNSGFALIEQFIVQ